ncbi:MAG: hypothetical protein NWE98_11610 [Candidatus Bathyarchaeota archaeon]|nr:hypothetical protein [Candidatus Bathyarchaeota archaeon]
MKIAKSYKMTAKYLSLRQRSLKKILTKTAIIALNGHFIGRIADATGCTG